MPEGAGPSSKIDQAAERQFEKERRLIDQSISMQAWIRGRDRTLALLASCAVLVASAIGLSYTFADNDSTQSILGLQADRATWLGVLSIVTFSASLIDLVTDRRGAARQRKEAVRALFELKREYIEASNSAPSDASFAHLRARYGATMGAIPDVPEYLFNYLKSRHLRKVAVSKQLSCNPGMPLWRARKIVRANSR